MEKYTKIYKEEQTLLFQTNSVACYEVYMHLKNKRDYFKNENVYDLTRCINKHINIPIRTIKDAISKLKKVGLISATRKGKVNYYSFPILEKIENNNNPIMKEDNPILEYDEGFKEFVRKNKSKFDVIITNLYKYQMTQSEIALYKADEYLKEIRLMLEARQYKEIIEDYIVKEVDKYAA